MKKKSRTLAIVIIIISAVIALSLFTRLRDGNTKDIKEQSGIPVKAETPEYRVMERILTFTGNLKPKDTVTILSKIPGKIEKIYVKEEDTIRKGEVLAKIEDASVKLQMNQAYSAWKAAEAQYNKAKKGARKEEIENAQALVKQAKQNLKDAEENLSRLERLYKNGAIPKSQYEESESKYRNAKTSYQNAQRSLSLMEKGASPEELEMARSNMEAMKSQYELARLRVDYTRITSPISGKVATIYVDEGNTVGQTTPILTVISEKIIEASILVPEKYYGEIKEKKDSIVVKIRPSAYPASQPHTGSISSVDSVIDPLSRTFKVRIDIDNKNKDLLPGMFVEADFVMEHYDRALTVPTGALVNRNGKVGVFLIKYGKIPRAKFVNVKTGIREKGSVQILKGLSVSDTVIVDGNSFLESGQEVRVITEK